MAEEDDMYIKKKYVHICTLRKTSEAIDEIIPIENIFKRKFRKFCLISPNVAHRRLYAKSNKVLEKERKVHLLNYYHIIHPFSDFSYYWGIFMIFVNMYQLIIAPILIINKVAFNVSSLILLVTLLIGNLNIIIQFNTGFYRYDIKEVIFDQKKIAKHYLKTLFIADLLGNFPIRTIMNFAGVDMSTIIMFKVLIAFNAGNYIKCLESFREKRDLDLIIFRLLGTFIISGLALLWLTALFSIAIILDQSEDKCKASMWWLLYLNYKIFIGTSTEFTYVGFEMFCQIFSLSFGSVMKLVILVQLLILLNSFNMNIVKMSRLKKEVNEFCNFKKIPSHLREKIKNLYDFKFTNLYYNETNIWLLLSKSMKQNILDYDTNAWFDGDIFNLCPLLLRQLISINLNKNIYLKGDVIYSYKDPISEIYFIKSGTVIIYDGEGNLANRIGEKNFFSEDALLLEQDLSHTGKAIACEDCQIFSLEKDVFRTLIRNFPDEYNDILNILLERREYLAKNMFINKSLILSDYSTLISNIEKK